MKIVVALGGNALLRRDELPTVETQQHHVEEAVRAIGRLAATHALVITHGNGPQVGLLALQAEAYGGVPPYPLDVLGAESEGMIGYVLEQSLQNRLPERRIATLLTLVVVDRHDPAFDAPTKPIGPVYDAEQARRLERELGWTLARDGDGFRRVVPSPEPKEIVELASIRTLVEAGALVVCSGGGGIPVVVDERGFLRGVEAVVDKDLAAELLARDLGADMLLMLTDVPAVMRGWRQGTPQPIRQTTPEELRALEFESGSMGPKVEAACRFVEATGATAAIGSLSEATRVVRGRAGTIVRRAQGRRGAEAVPLRRTG
jgi:carbamate kinase